MYRILSFVFVLFMFVSCGSGYTGIASKPDSDRSSDINDVDYEEVSDTDSDEVSGPDENPDTGEIPESDEVPESDEIPESDEVPEPGEVPDPDENPDPDEVPDPDETDDFDGDSIQIRIVAGNLTTQGQSYDPGEGIRIFQALKPDIVLVQEMKYGNKNDADYKKFAQLIVGTNYYVVEDPGKYSIPNGIVSRYPIKETGSWDDPTLSDRELKWAVIDIPGNTDIFAVSVHLHTKPASDQTTAAKVVVDEITKVKSKNPGKYYYVVGGDFNGPTAVSSGGFGKNSTFYVDGPDPVDEKGNGNTNASREKQYDFVLADYPLHEFQIPVVYYSSKDPEKTKTYENGLVFDTRVYDQSVLDEYFSPAQKNDSGASQMQHMAVVKDFLIEFNK